MTTHNRGFHNAFKTKPFLSMTAGQLLWVTDFELDP